MVEIAKAVSYEADVLIMDEPTSALTERGGRASVRRSSATCGAQGIGIVYITHKMNELFEIADEFSVFRDGKYIGTHASTDVDARRHHPHDGRPRDHPDVSRRRRCRSATSSCRVKNLASKASSADVSFDVRAGEILGVAGLVGPAARMSPKRCFGVDARDARARFELYGKQVDITSPTRRDPASHGVSDRRPQGYGLPADPRHPREHADRRPAGQVRQGAAFVAGKRASRRPARKWRASCASDAEPRASAIENLSGGNQQKVLIGRWLLDQSAHPHSR